MLYIFGEILHHSHIYWSVLVGKWQNKTQKRALLNVRLLLINVLYNI